MIVAIAMLAFAVFSWGVRYKVSLYNPATHMSAAKLLSQRERPATFESAKLAADPAVNLEPVTFFALAMGVVLAWVWSLKPTFSPRSVRHRAKAPKQPDQTFFFFRPPPVPLVN
ncbi:hypothetical protein P8936_06075 [Edaphobacter paludis]|uniref:Uncharacterized protein n=1 Tax=Edaphobacter paludis TaxID=3035702 RepID=A0AAU7D0V5_9BACT